MRSELRVGRLRGTGATLNLTTAAQVVGGLSVTLDVPKSHIAVVTVGALMNTNNSWVYMSLEVDGALAVPNITVTAATVQSLTGSSTLMVPAGKHALRVVCSANTAAGTVDPNNCTLSWIIAPQGGAA